MSGKAKTIHSELPQLRLQLLLYTSSTWSRWNFNYRLVLCNYKAYSKVAIVICDPVAPERIWKWENRSRAKVGGGGTDRAGKNVVVPFTFLALKVQLVVLVGAFVMVSTVWSISCLLFFYARCPRAQPFVKVGGTCLRAPWSRRHCGDRCFGTKTMRREITSLSLSPNFAGSLNSASIPLQPSWRLLL